MKIDYYNVKFNERGLLTEPNGYLDCVQIFGKMKSSLPKLILEESTLSNLEKLKLITRERLWVVAPCMQKEFEEWEADCIRIEREWATANGDLYSSEIVDTFLGGYKEYSTVCYVDVIQDILECVDGDVTAEFEIIRNRGTYHSTISKSVSEIIDRICKYAFENEIVGFVVEY